MSATTKSSFSYYIQYIVTALIVFSGHFLPLLDPLTREGMVLVTGFVGAIYGWAVMSMFWPAFVAVVSIGLNMGMSTILAAGLGNTVTWQVMFIFILVGLLQRYHVIEDLCVFFLTRKITKGRPWVLINVILLTAMVCSMLNGQAALIIYLGFVYTICGMLEIKPYSKFATAMGVGLCLACSLGQVVAPFKANSLQLVAGWQGVSGTEIDFVTYIEISVPIGIFIMVLYTLIMRFILRVDTKPLKSFDPGSVGMTFNGFNSEQRLSLYIFLITLVLFMVPSLLPETWAPVKVINNLTVAGQVLVPILIFMVVRHKGEPFINFVEIAKTYFPWELLAMMALLMPMSSFLCAESTGVREMMVLLLGPVINFSVPAFLLTVMAIVVVLTNVASNVVVGLVVIPVIYTYATSNVGLDPNAAFMILVFCTHFACLTPGATPYAATTFSRSDWIRQKEVFIWGIPTVIVMFLVTLPVLYFYARLFF